MNKVIDNIRTNNDDQFEMEFADTFGTQELSDLTMRENENGNTTVEFGYDDDQEREVFTRLCQKHRQEMEEPLLNPGGGPYEGER